MTKKVKRSLFLLLLTLFLLSAPLTILYSWGYRLDFKEKKITKTGAFYFKVWPKKVQIIINGKPLGKTDFFFGATYIDNILPKSYEVEIKKEGYHSWKKRLEVKESQVTDTKNVVLFEQNPKFLILSQNVEDFFVSPDQSKIILKETSVEPVLPSNSFSLNKKKNLEISSFSLKLLELDKNLKSHLITGAELKDKSVKEFVDSFFEIKNTEEKQKIEQLESEHITDGEISPDQKKIAYKSNSEIWVLFLKEEFNQPQKRAGEKVLLGRFSETINQYLWLNNYYLVFVIGGKIKIVEIDDRDKINIIDFAEFKEPKLFFNNANKKLYILSQGNLYVSERLVP